MRQPRSRYFMKYLMLLIVAANVSYGQNFNGTVFDLDTGRLQVISGSIDQSKSRSEVYQEIIDRTREDRLRIQADTDRIWAEMAAARAQEQLEEQTRLLRKIANE